MASSFQMVKRAVFLKLPTETRDFWWPFLRSFALEVWEIAGRRLAMMAVAWIGLGILYHLLVDLLWTHYYYRYYYERTHPEQAAHHYATTARTLFIHHRNNTHRTSSSSMSRIMGSHHDRKEKKAMSYMERAAQLHPHGYLLELAEWHLRAGRPWACLQTLQPPSPPPCTHANNNNNNDTVSFHQSKEQIILEEQRCQLLILEARAAMAASSSHANKRTNPNHPPNAHRNHDPTAKMNQIGALGPNGFLMTPS